MATVQEALDQIWSDEALKQRLFADPRHVLQGFGLDVPENMNVHIHENSGTVFNAVLPVKPAGNVSLGADPLSQIIGRAWSDASFKAKLLSDPKEAATEMGLTLPANVEVKVWENTATDEHMVLPANPVETELSEMELESVSGGTSKGAAPAASCTMVSSTMSITANTFYAMQLDMEGVASPTSSLATAASPAGSTKQ